MNVDDSTLLLYAVTDRTWLGGNTLAAQVEESVRAGVTFVQLREKELPFEAFVKQAKEIKEVTDRYRIPFVINDSIEVAIACDADGVHVGQSDLAGNDVRSLIGEKKILGISAQTVEQAVLAEQSGADYLGVGAMFSTSTKLDAAIVTYDTLKAICAAVTIPVVAIGGIGHNNVLKLAGSGVVGIAIVSAIFAQPDISAAAMELRKLAGKMVGMTYYTL